MCFNCSVCDHLAIKESYYSTPWLVCSSKSSKHPARGLQHYHSVGRTVTFSFVFSRSYEYAFLLEFASVGKANYGVLCEVLFKVLTLDWIRIVNTRVVSGRSGDTGVISSPHFPTVYPQDYSNEVKLQNLDFANHSQNGSIEIIFDDYALGLSSFLEVQENVDSE